MSPGRLLRKYRAALVSIAVTLLCPFLLTGQQYNFTRYSVRNGLPQSQVNCVFQDEEGFMWIGTDAGVSRFDGREFETFSNENGLPGNVVTAITETPEGILLATDSGIVVYAAAKFRLLPFLKLGITEVNAFIRGNNDDVLLATDAGLYRFENDRYTHIITSTPLDKLPVKTGYRDAHGNLWIGMQRNGLFKLQFANGRYTSVPFPEQDKLSNSRIRGITETEDGAIWIATSGEGLFTFDGYVLNKISLPEKTNTEYFTCVHKDMFGDIWLGTWGNGVVHYSHGVFRSYSKQNGLGDDAITSITSDRQGNTWFGTFTAGLIFFYGDQFTSLTMKDGLPDNNVHGITQDDEGNIWLATFGGLVMYDGVDVKVWTEKEGLSSNSLGAITTDGKKVYTGSLDGAVNVAENGKVTAYHPPAGLVVGEIISMAYSSDGSVWMGTVANGLFRFVNGRIEAVNTGNTLLYNPIWCVYESDDGVIWLGTEKGVFLMRDGNAVRPDYTGKPIPSLPVYGVQSDSVYIYFASQRNGVWRYDRAKHKYQVLNKEHEGLGTNFTKGIWGDSKRMYVTTTLGMDRIIFTSDSQQIRHYWYRDGIGTDNFFPGVMYISKDGRLWLGSGDGAIIFTPTSGRSRQVPPHVDIKEVLLFNSKTNWELLTDSIQRNGLPYMPELSYDQNQLTFHIAGIQFGAGVNIRYEYQLEGLDNKWNQLADGSSVSYSNLQPGHYRFVVRAGNSNNTWSEPAHFDFTIAPPFWATWWFFLSVLVVLSVIALLLSFLYRRFRIEFIRRHRTFGNYQLTTSRMVLLLSGGMYPLALFLCHAFEPALAVQFPLAFGISFLMLVGGLLTFYTSFGKKYSTTFAQLGYSLMILHVLYLSHVNHLHPVTVAFLSVVLGAGGVVFNNIRSVTVFSVALLLCVGLLMMVSGTDVHYNRWLLLLAVVVSIVIIFVNVVTRLSLFNRLIFADTTINNSRSLVLAADENGKIIFVSRSIHFILGYSEEEVLGDGWWKIRSDDQDTNKKVRDEILQANGTSPLYVTPIKSKTGSIHWIQWSDTELQGGIKVGIGLDVTDRREIEERYRHIVESATDLIYTADHRGKFTYINEVVSKITGYTPEDLLGKHFTDVVRPDYVDEVRSFYARQFSRKAVSTYLEFPTVARSGEVIWIGQTVRLLFDERRPTIIRGFQAIARDITEKKHYEEELEKLSLVASETINGVLICDPDGRIEWVNDGFTRITGYVLDEVKDRLPGDVLAGDRTDFSAISEVRSQSRNAEGFHREFLVYHKKGYEIWLAVSNTPIVDENGRLLKQIEIFNDITEKKRYEIQLNRYSTRLETLNMAKQQLLHSRTGEEIAQNVLGSLAKRLSYLRRVSIALFDERTGLVDFYYVLRDGDHQLNRHVFPMDSFRSIPTLQRNQHFLVRDLAADNDLSESDKENLAAGIRSYLMTPLYAQGQLIGSVNIGAAVVGAITEDDVEMVREVADAMAASLLQLRYLSIIEQKNSDISASILYARRIQDAILPPEEMLREQVGDLFVMYKPKDMLSGDFYWAEKLGEYTFVAVVDSTGHGVPGALLSLMGQNLLNQAVHERGLTRAAAILDYLNAGIQHTLNQYKKVGELRDGMDIALCVFGPDPYKMQFAGAINPMYIIRDGMLIQSKGNRFSIGSYFDNRMRPFTNQDTLLQPGDVVYLFTDGYPDQLGGGEDRKFSNRRFRELLLSIHQEPMAKQKQILEEELNAWIGTNVQTDDVCVIGMRIV